MPVATPGGIPPGGIPPVDGTPLCARATVTARLKPDNIRIRAEAHIGNLFISAFLYLTPFAYCSIM
jgi:hypothetical protein